MKLLVFSAFYGSPAYTTLACENHLLYCLKNGYDYLPLHGHYFERTPSWQKVIVGLDILKRDMYDAIFWMDGDSFFLNVNARLEQFMEDNPNHSFIFSRGRDDVINAGHFLARSKSDALMLLGALRDLYGRCDEIVTNNKKNGYLSDNPSICILLGGGDPYDSTTWASAFNGINFWESNPNKRVAETNYDPRSQSSADFAQKLISPKWRSICRVLPESAMNISPHDYCDGDFIVHFAGGSRRLLPDFISKIPKLSLPPASEESAKVLITRLASKVRKRLGVRT